MGSLRDPPGLNICVRPRATIQQGLVSVNPEGLKVSVRTHYEGTCHLQALRTWHLTWVCAYPCQGDTGPCQRQLPCYQSDTDGAFHSHVTPRQFWFSRAPWEWKVEVVLEQGTTSASPSHNLGVCTSEPNTQCCLHTITRDALDRHVLPKGPAVE